MLPDHIPELDGLRGIAVALVVFGHSWSDAATPWLRSLSPWGPYGVELFFVLSGFLITGILLDAVGTPHWWSRFYVRRALRIWPLYYLVFAIAWGVVPQWSSWRQRPGTAALWPYYVVFLQNFVLRAHGVDVLLITWSLAIEEQFYAVWPFVVRWVSRRGLVRLLVGLFVLLPVARLVTYHLTGELRSVAYWTWGRMDGLVAGAFLACVVRRERFSAEQLRRVCRPLCGVALPLALFPTLWSADAIDRRLALHSTFIALGLGGATGLALGGSILGGWLARGLRAPGLRYVGKISYGLYLWHPLVFAAYARSSLPALGAATTSPILHDLVALGTSYTLLLGIASLSWHHLEAPILSWKDRLAPRPSPAPIPAPPDTTAARPWRVHVRVGLAAASVAAAMCFMLDRPATLGLDTGGVVFPMTLEAFRSWSAASLPEWTDRFWAGFPLVGDPTSGALYPPHALGFLLTPGPQHLRAFDITAALHLGLLATGTSYLLTCLGAARGAAVVAAVLTSLSACTLWSAVAFVQVFLAMSWWPWCFAAAERLARPSARWPWSALALGWVAIAAQVLAGYPEYAIYTAPLAAAWVLLRRSALSFGARLARVAALAAGALALSAPQLLPTLAYLPTTIREQAIAAPSVFALTPGMTWPLLWPLRDATTGTPLFLGLATVALALVGAGARRPGGPALAATALVGIVLALGDATPFYRTLHGLPVLRLFRIPMKFLLIAEFAICWLAGLGLTALWQRRGAWRALAGALAALAIVERATYLGGWLPAIAALTTTTDVAAILRSIDRPPLVQPRRDVPPTLSFAMTRECGNIPAVANVPTISGGNVGLLSARQAILGRQLSAATLGLLGTRWLIAETWECPALVRRLGFRPVLADDQFCVLEHPDPMARYTLLFDVTPVASVEEMVERVRRAPREPVPIVATAHESPAPDPGVGPGRVAVVAYRPGHVALETDVGATRWLLAHEAWSPGWEATVDGAAAPIHAAAGVYLAVPVPSGRHRVVLRYRAPGLRAGLALAVAWSLGALALALARVRRRAAAPAPAGAG